MASYPLGTEAMMGREYSVNTAFPERPMGEDSVADRALNGLGSYIYNTVLAPENVGDGLFLPRSRTQIRSSLADEIRRDSERSLRSLKQAIGEYQLLLRVTLGVLILLPGLVVYFCQRRAERYGSLRNQYECNRSVCEGDFDGDGVAGTLSIDYSAPATDFDSWFVMTDSGKEILRVPRRSLDASYSCCGRYRRMPLRT